ncbi:hypothetical protein JTL90_32630, partial [Pseudomonas aeruginosa]|nr:hypothetical protein [Pseudomonas aeruginosa]
GRLVATPGVFPRAGLQVALDVLHRPCVPFVYWKTTAKQPFLPIILNNHRLFYLKQAFKSCFTS